jgi:hypothetical protein
MGLTIDLQAVSNACQVSAEVGYALRDYTAKQAIYLANPSDGNQAIAACSAITLTSLVSYYRGRS